MTEALLGLLTQPLWVFVSVLTRISPALMLAPPTRSSSVPMRFRAMFAMAIAAIATPIAMGNANPLPNNLINVGISMAGDALLGMLLGSIVMLSVASLQIAGQTIGHLAGFDIAVAVDPGSDEEMPVVSNILGLLAMAILLAMGGHRELMSCCLESFGRYPVGAAFFEEHWLLEFEQILRHTFVVGIRAAAPLATALLLANIVTGLLARTLPQLNVLAIGFNINALALLFLLCMTVGSVTWVFQTELTHWLDSCHRVVDNDI